TGAIRATASPAGPTVAETTAHPAANSSSSLAVSKAISFAGVLLTGQAYARGESREGGSDLRKRRRRSPYGARKAEPDISTSGRQKPSREMFSLDAEGAPNY